MEITQHAFDRTRQRMGLNADALVKMAATALVKGMPHHATKGKLRRYLDGIFLRSMVANNMRVYGHYIYLFRGEKLITIYNMPNELIAISDKLQAAQGWRQKKEK